VDGAADRSYGIHVARLAGLPAAVLARAEEVLHELESERTAEHLAAPGRGGRSRGGAADAPRGEDGRSARAGEPQVPLFAAAPLPLERELAALDPERLTPLDALQRLAEWKRRWSAETGGR